MATPAIFINNNFLLNIKNQDEKCFAYSIAAALNSSSRHNKNDPALYREQLKHLEVKNFTFPMSLSDIPRFELVNRLGINVFGIENKSLIPMYLSKIKRKRINLLLLSDGIRFHYCLITNFNAFMAGQSVNSTIRTKFCER